MTRSRRALALLWLTVVAAGCSPVGASPPAAASTPTPSASAASRGAGTSEPDGTPVGASPAPSEASSSTTMPDGTVSITGVRLPASLLAGDDAIWAGGATHITKINPETNRATPIVRGLPASHHSAIGIGESVWVVDEVGTITEYDVATGKGLTTLHVGAFPLEPTRAFGAIWVPNHSDGTISRVDPSARKVAATIRIGPPGSLPEFMAEGHGLLWAAARNAPALVGIDPDTNTVAKEIPICAEGVAYLVDMLVVWECDQRDMQIFDPETGASRGTVDLYAYKLPFAVDDQAWFLARDGPPGMTTLATIDPETLAVGARVTVRGNPETFAAAFDSLWLGGGTEGEITRVPFSVFASR